jgi:hypothetical protein
MVAECERKSEIDNRNEKIKAEILALSAEIDRALSGHGRAIPESWEQGAKLEVFVGKLAEKYALAKGQHRYYRAVKIHGYFATLDEARAFRGSLRTLKRATRKGIKGRAPAGAKEKAVKALIKAAGGDHQEALRWLINVARYPIGEAHKTLDSIAAEPNSHCAQNADATASPRRGSLGHAGGAT